MFLRFIQLFVGIFKKCFIWLFHRLIQDVQTYVEQLGEECAANVAVTRSAGFLTAAQMLHFMRGFKMLPLEVSVAVRMFSQLEHLLLFSSDNRDDHLPRTCVLGFLSRLDSSNLQHQRLMEELVMALLKKVDSSDRPNKTKPKTLKGLKSVLRNVSWKCLNLVE